MRQSQQGGPSIRALRVAEAIRHALAEILARGEVQDEALAGQSLTVSEVKLSPDLREATVFVLPLGDADEKPVLAALNRAAPFIASQVAKRVATRFVPRYRFRADARFAEASRIEALLASPRVARDLRKK
ncbi:MAG TPA: 30S ribosome-binding factor RbfA [Sphingomonadales bacterium]|nr:30S ribosome-binding factor RbfA [Sphingomonadales bacterium]